MKKNIVACIPARMGSSRFPGKPLEKILDLPLIEHVRRRTCLSAAIDDVYVATCDQVILDTVIGYGGKAIMTADTHERCTDRVEEASHQFEADIIVMVQGDEPLFYPEILDSLIEPFSQDENLLCTNLLSIIHDEKDLDNIDIVKAVMDQKNDVMYFSRSAIPYSRVRNNCPLHRQTGIAAFSTSFLQHFSQLPPTPFEIAESVDFLRILEHQFPIRGVVYDQTTIGVDRPDDIKKVATILKNDKKQFEYFQKIK